jgi:hypothetical protein
MPDILQIFKDIVKIDSDICEAKLNALKFDNPEKSVLNQEDDDLSKVCQLFIKNLCEEMVFRHFQMCQKASVNN